MGSCARRGRAERNGWRGLRSLLRLAALVETGTVTIGRLAYPLGSLDVDPERQTIPIPAQQGKRLPTGEAIGHAADIRDGGAKRLG